MAKDQVTVVVFKDNYAARSFKVPLGWVSRLGAGFGVLLLSTLLTTLVAVKYYRLAHQGDPARIGTLEEEIHELQASNETLQVKTKAALDAAAAARSVTPQPTATVTATPLATVAAVATPAALPTAMATTAAPAQSVPITAGNVLLFRDLPLGVLAPTDPSAIPITVLMQKVAWKGRSLNVQFAIQYTGAAGGNQQGRIVIVARGPSTLLAYPDQAFNAGTSPALIAPERGEYFSVSRYRETRAEFSGLLNLDAVKEVEILIFGSPAGASDESGFELLIHQRVPIEPAPKVVSKPAPRPRPKPEAKPPAQAPTPMDDTDSEPNEPTGSSPKGAGPTGAVPTGAVPTGAGANPTDSTPAEPQSPPAKTEPAPELVQ